MIDLLKVDRESTGLIESLFNRGLLSILTFSIFSKSVATHQEEDSSVVSAFRLGDSTQSYFMLKLSQHKVIRKKNCRIKNKEVGGLRYTKLSL